MGVAFVKEKKLENKERKDGIIGTHGIRKGEF